MSLTSRSWRAVTKLTGMASLYSGSAAVGHTTVRRSLVHVRWARSCSSGADSQVTACATCHNPTRAFCRREGGVSRYPWPRRSAQRASNFECGLQQDAVLGRSGQYARAAGGAADHEPFRDGPASIGDADPGRHRHELSNAIRAGLRSRRERAGSAARHCHLQRTLVSFDSPFDHFIAGDGSVIESRTRSSSDSGGRTAGSGERSRPGLLISRAPGTASVVGTGPLVRATRLR
jgi:hypothetical protein